MSKKTINLKKLGWWWTPDHPTCIVRQSDEWNPNAVEVLDLGGEVSSQFTVWRHNEITPQGWWHPIRIRCHRAARAFFAAHPEVD